MTATLSTRLVIRHLGDEEREVEVDYIYSPRTRELIIEGASARGEHGEIPVFHLLTQNQKAELETECVNDYQDRMDQVAVTKRDIRDGD